MNKKYSKYFNKHGYCVVENIISKELLDFINIEYDILMKADKAFINPDPNNIYYRGDDQIPKSFSWYSPFVSESLLVYLNQKASEIFGVDVSPSYSYTRMYYKGADMKIHSDRPSCQFSGTINLSIKGKPWPIWFIDRNNNKVAVNLNPGDICFYKGTDLKHWRDEFEGEEMLQFFLHYVETDGIYKDHIFDQRPALGLAK